MSDRQWLTVGASTLIAGALVSVALPSARPIFVVAASTVGAVGGTLLTKSPRSRASKLEATEALKELIVDPLIRLENLLIENNTELGVLKNQLNPRQSSVSKSLSNSDRLENTSSTSTAIAIISEQETKNISKIIDWLKARNFIVEGYKETQEVDVIFDRIAKSLGCQYPILKPFYKQIKFNISRGSRFSFRLNEKSKEDIHKITGFCKLLDDRSFLPCRYLPSEKVIIATPPTNPKMINFFNGDWFESFVYQQICNLLSENKIEYASLRQITGTFANGRDFELDMLFLIGARPLWVECKAGRDYNEYLTKYTKMRERMRIPKERTFLVIADLTSEQAIDYTNLWEITVASLDRFVELIANALGLVNSQEVQQHNLKEVQIAEIPLVSKSKLLKFLDKKSLHPFPEYRDTIIAGLIQLFAASNQSLTISQIKDNLSENLQISKSKISNILRALMRSECLLDPMGKPISSYTNPISSLVSLERIVLDQKCLETYAAEILAVNPNYFDDSNNKQEFQETTGGEIPDRETIKLLLEKENVEPVES